MKNKKLITITILAVLVFLGAGCKYGNETKPDIDQSPGNIVGADRDAHGCIGSAGYSWCEEKQKCLRSWEETCEGDTGNTACGIENCHGLDIQCGPNPAEMCTEIYQLGDKCRKHAKCGVQNGGCQQIQNAQFTQCKECVQNCENKNNDDVMKMFECEGNCN